MIRVISGVVLAAAVVAAILFLPLIGLRVIGVAVAILAAQEYLNIVRPAGDAGSARIVPVLLIVAVTSWQMLLPGPSTMIALLILAFGWLAVDVLVLGLSVHDAATRFAAPWYVGMPIGMLISVCGVNGPLAALLLLATVVVSDSAQYDSGRAFGKRPLAPTISPKKTIEGALGGVVFGTLFMGLAGPRVLPGRAPVPMAALGLAIVVLGICGDLFESRLKRASGLKDSSALIPGHGGVLDRIDALLFAAPAYYLFLR